MFLADISIDPLHTRYLAREVPRNVAEMREMIQWLRGLTRSLHGLRRDDMTPELQDVLAKMREMLLEKPTIVYSIGFGLAAMRLKRQGEVRLLAKFIEASYRFKGALLDSLERTDETFEQEKSVAVSEALAGWRSRPEVKPESVREWLDTISDSSHR